MTWRLMELVGRLHREESGAAMVEYAILSAVIAVVALTAARTLGTSVTRVFNQVVQALATV
ncbi:MAG: Flp family type IVb pilin [Dehalococcoidia bacterium]